MSNPNSVNPDDRIWLHPKPTGERPADYDILQSTLTRCQAEGTRLVEENRKLTAGLKTSMDSYFLHIDRYETTRDELAALKKEYDEEVISHDMLERDLKEQRDRLRDDAERMRIENAN